MNDVKWIKIATEMFDNRKIKQIRKLPEGDAIVVVWIQILCLAGQVNDNGIVYFAKDVPYTEEMLSIEFDRPINLIRLALITFERFKMIEIVDNLLLVSNWEKYQSTDKLQYIREQNRLRQQKFKEKQKLLSENNVIVTSPVTQGNATELELELELDKEKDICVKDDKKKSKNQEREELFETLWKAYPKKKGKGGVSDTQKDKLYKIGIDEMLRTIERYKADTLNTEYKFIKNGSTFFNSGYVDYLDANYEQSSSKGISIYKEL